MSADINFSAWRLRACAAVVALLIAVLSPAQTPDQKSIGRMTDELHTELQKDSLLTAADVAAKLDDAIQEQYRAWLIRDARQRVQDALSWVPADRESLWVNQAPFVTAERARSCFLTVQSNSIVSIASPL